MSTMDKTWNGGDKQLNHTIVQQRTELNRQSQSSTTQDDGTDQEEDVHRQQGLAKRKRSYTGTDK